MFLQMNLRQFSFRIVLLHLCYLRIRCSYGFLVYPRGGSFGYLAAVAVPVDLEYRNAYVAFNFEANYGLPSNDSHNEWIDRWNLDQEDFGLAGNVTAINARQFKNSPRYTRSSFYRCLAGYLEHYQMNGTACLLRTICEVTASQLDHNNGLLGSIFKILFMPTTSARENEDNITEDIYEAEFHGHSGNCAPYSNWCPGGLINLISTLL